jgi:hypothetical protein
VFRRHPRSQTSISRLCAIVITLVGVRTVFPADVFDVIGALLPGIPRRCSDGAQHKSRVEARPLGTRGSLRAQLHNNCAFEVTQPTAVVIDTAHRTVERAWRTCTPPCRRVSPKPYLHRRPRLMTPPL